MIYHVDDTLYILDYVDYALYIVDYAASTYRTDGGAVGRCGVWWEKSRFKRSPSWYYDEGHVDPIDQMVSVCDRVRLLSTMSR